MNATQIREAMTRWDDADHALQHAEEHAENMAAPLEAAAHARMKTEGWHDTLNRRVRRYTRSGMYPKLMRRRLLAQGTDHDRLHFWISNGIDLHDDFGVSFSLDELADAVAPRDKRGHKT